MDWRTDWPRTASFVPIEPISLTSSTCGASWCGRETRTHWCVTLSARFRSASTASSASRGAWVGRRHDRYGRLLAYVLLRDGRMVTEELVRQGWAMVLTIPPNVRYADRFVRAQQDARQHRRGLWSGSTMRQIALSETLSVRVPLGLLVGLVVSGTTAAAGLLAAHTTWRAAWFAPPFWRLMQVFSVLLLS